MGYMAHHAIIVTGYRREGELSTDVDIDDAHERAMKIFSDVSQLLDSVMNGYVSFCIPPDGSKEGWEDSEIGDRNRARFWEWCEEHEDRSFGVVEIMYRDDEKRLSIRELR